MMRGMKVCLVTGYTPREVSGVGEVVVNLGKGLQERDHDSVILTKSSREGGLSVPRLAEINYRNIRFVGGLLLVLGAARWILKNRKNIDILHSHSINWLSAICTVMGRALGKPCVLTLHGRFPVSSNRLSNVFFGLAERIAIAFSSKTTCVSQDTKDHYQLDSAIVVLNGIDTLKFHPDPEKRRGLREELELGDSFVLLFLARWVAHKGIFDTIEVVKDLLGGNTDLKLLLVGSGDDEEVREVMKRSSSEKDILPIGKVDDVIPYYQCSDMYVLFTSPLEGLPLTILEAMACGVPCIATSVSGITEVISDGVDGFLIKPGDRGGLDRALRLCVKSRTDLKEVSMKAREKVEKEFSLGGMTDNYLQIYSSLLKG